MDLDEYQARTTDSDIRPDPTDVAFPLLGLAGEVGELVTAYKKLQRSGHPFDEAVGRFKEELGDLLWYAAALANTLDLSLNDIATSNLDKARLAWRKELSSPRVYDENFPTEERFPRQFEIKFVEEPGDPALVSMHYLGSQLGDTVDDNAPLEDFYRYHDAMHLAHCAVLGWSPTIRALLRRKRKSNPEMDRVEDGARAIFLEEGLIAFIFGEAANTNFFAGADRIDWDLLKAVRRITGHLEVRDQQPSAWQAAILQGYEVWRQLRVHRGGWVIGDLDNRTLQFRPPKE